MLTAEKQKPKTHRSTPKIPESLIYEIMDGEPLYYKGYREVVSGRKTIEEIMGSSTLQSLLVEYFNRVLIKGLDENKYRIFSNETGVHISHRTNMANDIAVYEKSVLTPDKINKKYADVPCKIAVEIDIKADLSKDRDYSYVQKKTQKLLDFGIEKVIWIFTGTQKITVAVANENWQTMDWHKDVEMLEGLVANIGKYLDREGIKIEIEE